MLNRSTWLLHVSDFHIREDNAEFAEKVLSNFAAKLEHDNYAVDIVLHTGDIIDSRLIGFCIPEEFFNEIPEESLRLVGKEIETYITKFQNLINECGFAKDNRLEDTIADLKYLQKLYSDSQSFKIDLIKAVNGHEYGAELKTVLEEVDIWNKFFGDDSKVARKDAIGFKDLQEKIAEKLKMNAKFNGFPSVMSNIFYCHIAEWWFKNCHDTILNRCKHSTSGMEELDALEKAINSIPTNVNGEKSNLNRIKSRYADLRRFMMEKSAELVSIIPNDEYVDNYFRGHDGLIRDRAVKRFNFANDVIKSFLKELNVTERRFVPCSGNHDILRLKSIEAERCSQGNYICNYIIDDKQGKRREVFDTATEDYGGIENDNLSNSAKCSNLRYVFPAHELEIFCLDTNCGDPDNRRSCCNCQNLAFPENSNYFKVVLGHKPLYELCETAVLPYNDDGARFMSQLRAYLGVDGVYICGDKHTRSMSGTPMFGIPHYLGGSPIMPPKGDQQLTIEYNLIEIIDKKIARERLAKIVVMEIDSDAANSKENSNNSRGTNYTSFKVGDKNYLFKCTICPQKKMVSDIYVKCRDYISSRVFENLNVKKEYSTWDNIKAHVFSHENEYHLNPALNYFFRQFSVYRVAGESDSVKDKDYENIFDLVAEKISCKIQADTMTKPLDRNILNIRGDSGVGKSTFLGYLFLDLLRRYQAGEISYIPVLYTLHNKEIEKDVSGSFSNTSGGKKDTYREAVRHSFDHFFKEILELTEKETCKVLILIDGLDEQDCWSYSTEYSAGRALVDIMARQENIWYAMSYTRLDLPLFKNTMPPAKLRGNSDVMFLNNMTIRATKKEDFDISDRMRHMLEGYLTLNSADLFDIDNRVSGIGEILKEFSIKTVNLRLLNDHNFANPNIIEEFKNTEALCKKNWKNEKNPYFSYYIERQHELCYERMGYDFLKYVPIMAYLFSYKGCTYQQFEEIANKINRFNLPEYLQKPLVDNSDKIYDSFIFIKKRSDVRNYLMALHYNQELMYYTENPDKRISSHSILHQFIYRDTAVMIRKLWTDPNKLIKVINGLLKREQRYYKERASAVKGDVVNINGTNMMKPEENTLMDGCYAPEDQENFPVQAKSMLMYCLSNNTYIDAYNKSRLTDALLHVLEREQKELFDFSEIYADGMSTYEKTMKFLQFTFMRSILLYHESKRKTLWDLLLPGQSNKSEDLSKSRAFCDYNMQCQLLYYQDRTIHGHKGKKSFYPGKKDEHFFYNTYAYMCGKIKRAIDKRQSYELIDFDIISLCQLMEARTKVIKTTNYETEIGMLKCMHELVAKRSKIGLPDELRTAYSQYLYIMAKKQSELQEKLDEQEKSKNKVSACIDTV